MSGGDLGGGGTRDALHALCLTDPVWTERYEGWTELGRGGSAAVVRVFNRDAGGDVAIKVFYGLAAEDRVRFEREVRGAQRLASPFIVRTFSPFARGSLAWIEMELVDGVDLRQELGQRAATARGFSLAESCGIAACLAEGLGAAHAADVVHRDVKPANVLLPASGSPAAKLSDFGISRILGATRVTSTGLLAGTPQFAAPEAALGADVGPAADIYSLALCLYLMLSGNRFPYDLSEGATVAQWLRAHSDAQPRPIRSFDATIPSEVADLVTAGLAKDPLRRPTAAEFLAELLPWTSGALEHSGRRLPGARRSRASVRRLGGYAGALLVGLGIGAWLMGTRHAPSNVAPSTQAAPPAPASSPAAVPSVFAHATPPRVIPLATASPSSTRPETLRVAFQGGLLRIANAGKARIADLRIALRGADGTSHEARLPEPLTPGDEVFLAADSFVPSFAAGFAPLRAEIAVGEAASGGRVYAFPLTGEAR